MMIRAITILYPGSKSSEIRSVISVPETKPYTPLSLQYECVKLLLLEKSPLQCVELSPNLK